MTKRAWPTKLLSDAFFFQEGPGVRKWQFTTSGIKLLNVANIEKSGYLNLEKTDRHLSEEEVKSRYSHFLVDEGDLVIASSGISFDSDGLLRTRGAFVYAEHIPLCLNTSTIRFKAIEGVSDLAFLRHWIDSLEFRRQITRRVTGTAQQNFGPSHLKELKITLPPLSEQKRIAEILDRAESLRAKRRAALALLDELTQSIFLDMFGDPVTNPKGWPIKSLEEAGVKTKTGPFGSLLHKSDYIQGGVPLVNPKHMIAGTIEHDGDETVAESKAKKLFEYRVQIGDLLMARRGEMGRCAIVHETHDGWLCGTGSFFIRAPANIYLAEFLESTLSSHPMRKHLENLSGGAIMPSLSGTQIKSLRLPLPPIGIQRTFVETVKARGRQLDLQKRHSEELDALFASLQNRAFRGEL